MAHTVLAVIADTHIGSTKALCSPNYKIHSARPNETQIVPCTIEQAALYKSWVDYWTYIRQLLEYEGHARKNKLAIVHLGDVIDGDHHGTNQIMPELEDQRLEALTILQPVFDSADIKIGIIGTPAHAGNSGNSEYDIYKQLGCQQIGENESIEIDGVLHNFAHSCTAGYIAPLNIINEVSRDCWETGEKMPNVIWRAHIHKIRDTGFQFPNTRVIVVPSWQLKTSYAHAKFPNATRSDIGALIYYGGKPDWTKARYSCN